MAAACGFFHVVEHLLHSEKVRLNFRNSAGKTVLFLAAQNGRAETLYILCGEVGLDPNLGTEHGTTPLMVAVQEDFQQGVEILVNTQGIDPNCKDNNGFTAFQHAVSRRHLDLVLWLLQRDDINPNCRDKHGSTPLYSKMISPESSRFEQPPDLVEPLVAEPRIDVDAQNADGRTMLHRAILLDKTETVSLLLSSRDTDPSVKDDYGRTPLSYAAETGLCEAVQLLMGQPLHLDINTPDNNVLEIELI